MVMALLGSLMERRIIGPGFGIHICAMLNEPSDHGQLAKMASNMEWSVTLELEGKYLIVKKNSYKYLICHSIN
jgi:hypothetical protein